MAAPRGKFLQAVGVLLVAFLLFKYAIRPPMPFSLLSLYMTITLIAVLIYVSSDSESWRAFVTPIRRTLVDPRRRPLRLALGVILPLLIGYYTYSRAAAQVGAPLELRAIHPAPPPSITFRGTPIDLQTTENPVRKDVANRDKHLANGAATYIRNCLFCHGDDLDGHGPFAHGFNPQPANFNDPTTIAMLQESYLFWRIAKGGPGLPRESKPWNSAMPSWEDRLSVEEIWEVIFYLYEATGYQPRRWETSEGGHAALTPDALRSATPSLWSLFERGFPPVAARRASAQEAADPARGKVVYEKHCVLCHGADGKGDGPGAERLLPKPRDFTAGKYKIRTTASGQLPTDEDLRRVIADGMPGSAMPSWKNLDAKDHWALVAYVKTFANGFKGSKPELATVPPEVKSSQASIKRGQEMFEAIECNKCHGQAGRGDPAPGSDLKDDWGNPIRPADLHHPWTFRGGPARRDVVMRLVTGLMGTPMPTFADTVEDYRKFKKEESESKKDPRIWEDWKDASTWDIANYVRTLGPDSPDWASLLEVLPATGDVPSDPNAEFWQKRPAANFPLVGQVIVDPRNFHPTVDMISIRAAYTDQEVAFHLTWDDPTASDSSRGAAKPDQVALQFPVRNQPEERPYFLMGEAGKPVYLLTWQAGAGVGEANAEGIGKVVPQAGEAVQAKGQAVYDAGQYRVVIRRALKTPDPTDFAFSPGEFFPVAMWVWDGSEGDAGGKAAISTWYYARLAPPPSRRKFVVPPIAALVAVVAELGITRWARQRPEGDA